MQTVQLSFLLFDSYAMLLKMGFYFGKDQRKIIAEKVMELGNLAFAGLVISQMLVGIFDFQIASIGLIMFLSAYLGAFYMMRGGGT